MADEMDKRIALETARVLHDYYDEITLYPEGKIMVSKFGSIKISGFPKELTKIIRSELNK